MLSLGNKKGRVIGPCLSVINRLCVFSLLFELSTDPCNPNQPKSKKQPGGGFGGMDMKDILPVPAQALRPFRALISDSFLCSFFAFSEKPADKIIQGAASGFKLKYLFPDYSTFFQLESGLKSFMDDAILALFFPRFFW